MTWAPRFSLKMRHASVLTAATRAVARDCQHAVPHMLEDELPEEPVGDRPRPLRRTTLRLAAVLVTAVLRGDRSIGA